MGAEASQAVPDLLPLYRDPSSDVRQKATEALARIRGTS